MKRLGLVKGAFATTILALLAADAAFASETCREWAREHEDWKAQVVRLYLRGASSRELDSALFELMQREAYLTACPAPVQAQRPERIGWRLVGRPVEEYGSAVVESLLDQAGFDVELRTLFEAEPVDRRHARREH
jgi:hypothetical protein